MRESEGWALVMQLHGIGAGFLETPGGGATFLGSPGRIWLVAGWPCLGTRDNGGRGSGSRAVGLAREVCAVASLSQRGALCPFLPFPV